MQRVQVQISDQSLSLVKKGMEDISKEHQNLTTDGERDENKQVLFIVNYLLVRAPCKSTLLSSNPRNEMR